MTYRLAMTIVLGLIATQVSVPAEDKDIRCQERGEYIGNLISPVYTLTISGPKEKKWEYTYIDNLSGTVKEPNTVKAGGTYEIEDDLVIFTGRLTVKDQQDQREGVIRIGLNFGFPDKKVLFNRFFPAADGTLRYHAKWFRKIDGDWKPMEERILILPQNAPQGNQWAFRLKGERIRWDKTGKKTVEKVDEDVVWKKAGFEWSLDRRPAEWVPATLSLQVTDGSVSLATPGSVGIGELRGFNLRLGEPVPEP